MLTPHTAILNNTPELVTVGRKKTKKDVVTSELYSIDEFADIVASESSSRLIIRRDNIKADLSKTVQLKKVLWQMVTCAHSTDLHWLRP